MSESVPFLSDEQLIKVLSLTHLAVAIHITEDAIIQTANPVMLKVWGKDESVIGKSLADALPELRDQPFIGMFKRVWNEGLTISGTDTPAVLEIDGELVTKYFDFEYRAIKNAEGKTYCILHTATEITERYLSKIREQNLTEELSATNEELVAANEELVSSVEELTDINEELEALTQELRESQYNLQKLNDDLIQSESRFRYLIKQAPVGICVIRADDLMVTEVNDNYLELVGKTRKELESRTIWEAVAEASESYAPVLQQVIETGVAFIAKEHEISLIRYGLPQQVFINFVYEPVMNPNGNVSFIMVVVVDVTEQVLARKAVEETNHRLQIALDAGLLGSTEVDLATGRMVCTEQFKKHFGRTKDEEFYYAQMFEAMLPEYRDRIRQQVKYAQENHTVYQAEYEIKWPDGTIHWISAHGKARYDENGKANRMVGVISDITESKLYEQRKDDFLSIASHELKTPITSLKATLQLLERMKNDPSPAMLPRLMDQAGKSMNKITSLINDLLNVSKMNEGELQLNKSTFTLSAMLNSCCDHVRIAGKHKLIFEGDAALQVFADEHRIDQVVINMVNNAVKYAPDSPNVYLGVEKQGDMAKVSVRDNGPGIAPEKLSFLFDRYFRAAHAGQQYSGLGLGLYISAEIVKRHGGQIGVNSEVGKGSTFWFTLPLGNN
jgi:PAS domain S-box-containing protein